jgi:hypothetical protein
VPHLELIQATGPQAERLRRWLETAHGPDPYGPAVIEGLGHRFDFTPRGELPHGPAYLSVAVGGPFEDLLSRLLAGRDAFLAPNMLDTQRGLMAFELAADAPRIQREVIVVDLARGKVLASVTGDLLGFEGFRPGRTEMVYRRGSDDAWLVLDLETGASREVIRFTDLGIVTPDGSSLLLVETGTCKVMRVDLDDGAVLGRLGKRQFRRLCAGAQTLTPGPFDTAACTLAVAINYHARWTRGRVKVSFDGAALLRVATPPRHPPTSARPR